MRLLFFSIVFLLSMQVSLAQREASRWYFGVEAGLDFNNGAPVALTDGELETHEGCSSISDQNGNLLFYSDGINVWDKAHKLMPNGTGLLGHESSTQSAIIIPKAGSKVQYYIFTVDEPDPEEVNNNGLNYTLVDLSLNNGFGDVVATEKNIHLVTYNQNDPLESKLKCSEKITAVQHNDENSIWVITHFKNSFYSFRVDGNGVNTTPVVSTTPTDIPVGGYKQNGIGYLKVSPDGTKIAVAHSQTSNSNETGPKIASRQSGKVLLYDFNTTTGNVTNELTLLSKRIPYGIEFSPKSSKLYTTVNNYESDGSPLGSSLYQFDLSAGNIVSSIVDIKTYAYVAGALQLAIDGKIYRAGYPINGSGSSLSVINNPETKGISCNFQSSVVSLNGKLSELGLPPFVQSFFILKFEYKNVCLGDATEFKILGDVPPDTVEWDFGDGQTSNDLAPLHTYQFPGDYTVSLTKFFNGFPSDPITKELTIFDAPSVPQSLVEYFQCTDDVNANGIGVFNLSQINSTVSLDTDQIINVFYYNDLTSAQQDVTNSNALPNIYTNKMVDEFLVAKVYNAISGCYSFAEVQLKMKQSIVLNGPILRGCDLGNGTGEFHLDLQREEIRQLFNLPGESTIRFYPNENSALLGTANYFPDLYISSNKTIYIRVDNENICYGSGEFRIEVEKFDIDMEEEVRLCENNVSEIATLTSGVIAGSENDHTYLWSSGETTSTIDVNIPGTYSVIVTNDIGCTKERTIKVIETIVPEIKNVDISNDTVRIITPENGDYEYAIVDIDGPYQSSNFFTNVPAGIISVYVKDKNGCGIASQEISVIVYPLFFTPNGDSTNEYWQIQGVASNFLPESPIYIFDRYGSLLKQLDPLSQGWDGTFNGKPLSSSDYWFRVQLNGGNMLKGHFALKR